MTNNELSEPPSCVMILGRTVQLPLIICFILLVFTVNLVVSILSIYQENELSDTITIISTSLGILLSIILYYAPFNLVRILNNTISDLVLESDRYDELNDNHQQQIASLTNHNDELSKTIGGLHNEMEKMEKIETGLKSTSQNLLKLLAETSSNNIESSKITKSLELIADDIEDNLQENMSCFMKQLLSMDTLEEKLNESIEKNNVLTHELESSINSLRKLVLGQEQNMLKQQISDLTLWIDSKADGEEGIRANLNKGSLTSTQMNDVLKFLLKLDNLISIHDKSVQIADEISSRHLNLNIY